MRRDLLGVLLGMIVGVVDVDLMLSLTVADKATAFAAAFSSRFAFGFLAASVVLPWHQRVVGGLEGLLVNIPDALITKAYAPILITGVVFGVLSGLVTHKWGRAVREI